MKDAKFSIAVAQMDCVTGVVEPNLNKIRHFTELAAKLGAQLVIFPECATTGYFVGDKATALADTPGGAIELELGDIARKSNISLVCGMYARENGLTYNSQKVFGPDGRCLITYHKAHLFAVEKTLYSAGDKPAVVDTPIGRLGLTICYDLMFPHYSRKLIEMGADIIINSTTWIHNPYQRDMWGWDTERTQGLASTRAFENVSFLAMACRTGRESINPELTFDCFGASCVVSPSGKFLARQVDGEGVAVAHVDIAEAELEKWRGIASYRADRRPELYK